jgi:hypothetical protein
VSALGQKRTERVELVVCRSATGPVCKPNCKPTARHSPVPGITRWDGNNENTEREHTLTYWTAQVGMRILELENRCTRKRTVGSNPTLSAS